MNVVGLMTSDTQVPRPASFLTDLMAALTAELVVCPTQGKITDVVSLIILAKAGGRVAVLAVFAIASLVYRRLRMAGRASLLRTGKTLVFVAVRAQQQSVSPIYLEEGLAIVVEDVLPALAVALLTLVAKAIFVNIVFLVTGAIATIAGCIRKPRFGVTIETLRNDLVPPNQLEIGMLGVIE